MRYATQPLPLPVDLTARTAEQWRAQRRRDVGTPLQNAVGLVGGMSVLGGLIGALPMLGGKPYAVAAPLGLAAFGGLLALLIARRAASGDAELEQRIAKLAATSVLTEHVLDLDGPHRFIPHEHGVVVLLPLDAGQAVLFDVSSVADDPRYTAIEAALRAEAVPRRWRWLESPDGEPLDFTMTGDRVVPVVGEEGWSAEASGPFQMVIDAQPQEGIVAEFDFAAYEARVAADI